MANADITRALRLKYQSLAPLMDEPLRRWWAAAEAMALGWGGVSAVAQATRISRPTIYAGIAELRRRRDAASPAARPDRQRRAGGGRKPLVASDPRLLRSL